MARPLRIELAGGLYHVTSRGDRREDIYAATRIGWPGWTCSAGVRALQLGCHAYCLMTNHYHLSSRRPTATCRRACASSTASTPSTSTARHGRVGHVFQGRYKAILVEKDSYLLEVARYVVLNPVRAGMVTRTRGLAVEQLPRHDRRSAGRAWLQTDWLLGQFSVRRRRAVAKYVDFVRDGVGLPSLWDGLRNQIYLGGEKFVNRCRRNRPRRPIWPKSRARSAGRRPIAGLSRAPPPAPEPRWPCLSEWRAHDEGDRGILRRALFDREPGGEGSTAKGCSDVVLQDLTPLV